MMEVREVYYMGDHEAYPQHPRFERAVFDPPHTGWGRVIVVPQGEGRSVMIDPTSLAAYNVSNDCEELATSKSADDLPATIRRLCRNLVERDKLGLSIPRLGLDTLKAAGVQLPEIKATSEPEAVIKEKPVKEPKRPSREGLVSVSSISEGLKISPKEARAALRRAKIEKPEVGWAWSPSEVEDIKKKISENLK